MKSSPLLILVILAFLARLLSVSGNLLIERDSTAYLQMAKYLSEGNISDAMSYGYHPFYPFLITATETATGSYEFSGYLVSIILSSLTTIFIYKLAIITSGKAAAIIASLLYIFHPSIINYHNEIMTEASFEFFFVGCVFYFVRGLFDKRLRNTFYCIFMFLLSYAVRPDSLFLIPIFLAVYSYKFIRTRECFHLKSLAVFIATFVILAASVLLLTGKTLSVKPSVAKLLSLEFFMAEKIDMARFGSRLIKGVNPVLILLSIMSLKRCGKQFGLFYLLPVVNYVILLLFSLKGWTQTRYFVLSAVFLVIPVAHYLALRRTKLLRLLAILFLAQGLYITNRWEKIDLLTMKRASLYILEHYGANQSIASDRRDGIYYARGKYCEMDDISEAKFLILERGETTPDGFKLLKQFPAEKLFTKHYNVYIRE